MISLQQVGNVKYLGWYMKFPCKGVIVEDLQRQVKQMENELERWKHEVESTRNTFYELNYFTTQQLLVLQRELGKVRSSAAVLNEEAQVMVLLQSISNELTTTGVRNVVQKLPLQETSIDSSSSDCQFGYKPQKITPPKKVHPEITSTDSIQLKSFTLSLSRKDLNEQQKVYFTDIISLYGLCEKTALKAIEDVGNGDWNEILNWLKEKGETVEAHFGIELEKDMDRAESEEEEESESTNNELAEIHVKSCSLVPTGKCSRFFVCCMKNDGIFL